MQRYLLSKKKTITVVSGILILFGFFTHFTLGNTGMAEGALILASVMGRRRSLFKRCRR